MAVVPYYASVSLLLHCDGANGSTTFTDNSPSPITLTAAGNAAISTAQSKWGGASAVFDGTGDKVTTPYSSAFALESGDFTVEAWVYRSSTGSIHTILGNRPPSAVNGWGFRITAANVLNFYFTGGSVMSGIATISASAWHHVSVARSGNTVRLFVDGNLDNSATFSNGSASSTELIIGLAADGTEGLSGYIDDMRITKGIARYTGAFTPPAEAFPNMLSSLDYSLYAGRKKVLIKRSINLPFHQIGI